MSIVTRSRSEQLRRGRPTKDVHSTFFSLSVNNDVKSPHLPYPLLPTSIKMHRPSSFLLRGTIAQVTTALDAAQRAAEDELALNEAGWDR